MVFTRVHLEGAQIIDIEKREDSRGFFGRAYCRREFDEHGLATQMVQTNVSYSERRGTLRGMHYQTAPFEEAKLVRCTRGAIYDVIVDVRPSSSTFREWIGVELTEANHRMLYVPEGFAHGFITLSDAAEVMYQVSQFYSPGSERGFCYDDSEIGIEWPLEVNVISDKDKNWSPFTVEISDS